MGKTIRFTHAVPAAYGKIETKSFDADKVDLDNPIGIAWKVGTELKIIPYTQIFDITIGE